METSYRGGGGGAVESELAERSTQSDEMQRRWGK